MTTAVMPIRSAPCELAPLFRITQLFSGPITLGRQAASGTAIADKAAYIAPHRREELLRRMTPERRALFDEIRKLKTAMGPTGFNVAEAIREYRANG